LKDKQMDIIIAYIYRAKNGRIEICDVVG